MVTLAKQHPGKHANGQTADGDKVDDEIDHIIGQCNTHITQATIDHPDSSVTAAKLAADSVTTVKIDDDAVTAAKIADGAIIPSKFGAGGSYSDTLTTAVTGTIDTISDVDPSVITDADELDVGEYYGMYLEMTGGAASGNIYQIEKSDRSADSITLRAGKYQAGSTGNAVDDGAAIGDAFAVKYYPNGKEVWDEEGQLTAAPGAGDGGTLTDTTNLKGDDHSGKIALMTNGSGIHKRYNIASHDTANGVLTLETLANGGGDPDGDSVSSGDQFVVVAAPIRHGHIGDREVETYHLRDEAVTTAKIADDSVTDDKMADNAIHQANLAVSTEELSVSGNAQLYFAESDYNFWPKLKTTNDGGGQDVANVISSTLGPTYRAFIELQSGAATTIYATATYITASRDEPHVWMLRKKSTGEILSMHFSPETHFDESPYLQDSNYLEGGYEILCIDIKDSPDLKRHLWANYNKADKSWLWQVQLALYTGHIKLGKKVEPRLPETTPKTKDYEAFDLKDPDIAPALHHPDVQVVSFTFDKEGL